MKEKYESLSLTALKEIAKARGMKHVSAKRKADLVDAMLEMDEVEKRLRMKPKDQQQRNVK